MLPLLMLIALFRLLLIFFAPCCRYVSMPFSYDIAAATLILMLVFFTFLLSTMPPYAYFLRC